MTQKQFGPGEVGISRRAGDCVSAKTCNPKDRLRPSLGQTPRYVRLPIFNDDYHLVGHELVRIGPGLDAFIRQMAEEAR